ncbi:RNI-like protein [Neocallimastix sp. 'constans']
MDIIENLETTMNPLTINTTNLNILNNNSEINNENDEKQDLIDTNQNFINTTNENNEDNTSLNNINSEDNLLSPSTFANLPSPSSSQTLNNIDSLNDNGKKNNNLEQQNVKKDEEKIISIHHDESIYHCSSSESTVEANNSNKYTYHLYNLPNEILIQIGRLIDIKSLGRMCQTSKLICSVFYSAEELWQNLNLSKKNTIGGGKFDNDFPILDNIEYLLNNPERNHRFYSLKKIDLSISVINDLSIFEKQEVLNCCSKLTRINLTSCKHIDPFSIYYLKKLPCLETLDLCYCDQINDLSLKIISDYLPNLKHLDLSYLSNITEEGLRHLLKLPELETVKVLGCFHIRSYFWSYLGEFRNRGILPIRRLVIGEHGKSQFRLPKFCVWRMNDLVNYCPLLETLCLDMVLIDWTNNSLQTLLDGCTKLKELSLLLYDNAWDSFTETSQSLEKLEKLELTIHCGLSITENAIDHICKPNVTSIRFLQKASIFDANEIISKIESKCKIIQSIEMNGSNFKDEGIDKLYNLKESLLELSLYEPTVNNKLINALSKMKLKDLNLSDMKKVNFSNHFKKLFRGNKIKGKPKKLLYDPIESEKLVDANFKNKVIKGKKNYNHIYNPVKQYEGTVLSRNIVELELNSKEYFQDSDLQNIGIYSSSPECQSLVTLSQYGKKIRFLQLCGPIGLTDYTLDHISNLASLNTFWIKECNDFTFDGICKFSEAKWKTLKRLIITDCKNVKENLRQKVHILKDLEIDLIIENKD